MPTHLIRKPSHGASVADGGGRWPIGNAKVGGVPWRSNGARHAGSGHTTVFKAGGMNGG